MQQFIDTACRQGEEAMTHAATRLGTGRWPGKVELCGNGWVELGKPEILSCFPPKKCFFPEEFSLKPPP
jgi:hypothetical protein